tara:strand:+ start:471 stop:986 length:516 start_codon:yes stop_codon:yes gene_type:complete
MKIKKIIKILEMIQEYIGSGIFSDSNNVFDEADYLYALACAINDVDSNSIRLPESNMTNGKYRDNRPTQQFCVIPNTEANKKAIKHWNKLATEQNSRYRFKTRYRCPKEGVAYGTYGGVDAKDAEGLGIYIDDVKANYNSTINDRLRRENMELKRALNDMERIINNTRKGD